MKEIVMPAMLASPYVLPILMLLGSNIFMTLAWYGHLRFKEMPLVGVIFVAWGIALVEYFLAVPANRWGNAVYTTAQLKTIQDGHHPPGVCRVLGALSQGSDHLESRGRFCVHRAGSIFRLSRAALTREQQYPDCAKPAGNGTLPGAGRKPWSGIC
jgi:hypothetical protein